MELDFSKIKKAFFIGIGGIGISALAKMLSARGIEVSGVNDEKGGKTLEALQDEGIKVSYLDGFQDLPDADLYVYSDAWTNRGPEVLEKAKKTGKPVLSYFEALGKVSENYEVIAISGTHGKTTTTAMVAEIMIEAGLDPTVIVGSFVKKFSSPVAGLRPKASNFRKGESEYLVVEADEYNRHFLNFYPLVGLVTNIEADHLDYYRDLEDIKSAFREFLNRSEHPISNYSEYLDRVPELRVPGEHNRQNAAAALAVADHLGIDEKVSKKALENFEGTWRRLEKRAELENGLTIYDDYSHHPTEIKAALSALRELYPDKKIILVFQPHLYSRTKALFGDFVLSFGLADKVLLLPIYFAREDPDESISSFKLAQAARMQGTDAEAFADFGSAEGAVRALKLGSGAVLVTMGAGEAYKVADRVFDLTK